MNDQTLRNRLRALRVPPVDSAATERALDCALAARRESPEAEAPVSRWTWRDWLWPSPLAWSAMAALWIIIAANAMKGSATKRQPLAMRDAPELVQPLYPVFARYDYAALLREIQEGAPLR